MPDAIVHIDQMSIMNFEDTCNRFQTHKRFKRFEVYKSDVLVLLF